MEGREGDLDFILDQIGRSVAAYGATGRISTWSVCIDMLMLEIGVLYSIEFLEGRTDGRHDRAILERVIAEVAETYNTEVTLNNWPLGDGTYLDNFYLILPELVTF